MFGGLDICSLEAVVAKDGQEVIKSCISPITTASVSAQVIIEVNDCALNLMGESQEEDRRKIAEMVLKQMEEQCLPNHTNGVVESELNSDAENPVEGDKKVKSLPGPVQRGPQRRISSSQGGTSLAMNQFQFVPLLTQLT